MATSAPPSLRIERQEQGAPRRSHPRQDELRVSFDVGHPAQVHLFRNAICELRDDGHEVIVLSREKEMTTTLLDAYGIDHVPLSRSGNGLLGLVAEWGRRSLKVARVIHSFEPDVVVSHVNVPAVFAGRLAGASSVVFTDVEVAPVISDVTYPVATRVCTPTNFGHRIGGNQRCYEGFHELAYLHPNRFEPDASVLDAAGVDVDEPYAVVRFVGWNAYHDVGQQGLSPAGKRELVETLAAHANVYITSESPLPADLRQYRLPVPPHLVHHLLAYADAYVGDSQAMAAESAVLGTPAVRLNSFVGADDMSKFKELEERYGLLYSFSDERQLLERVETLLTADEPDTWRKKRDALIADKIDVTAYMLETIAGVAP